MNRVSRWRAAALAMLAGVTMGVAWNAEPARAQQKAEKGLPFARHATLYPAHESHTDEQFSVAADPYETEDKAEVFRVGYLEHGLLPIQVVLSNDGDEIASLVNLKVQLITARRVKLEPATRDDILRRVSGKLKRPDQKAPLPWPFPRKVKPLVERDAKDEIDKMVLYEKAVQPHATLGTFAVFDVSGIDNPVAGAKLFVTGIQNGKGQELFYFEIPLEKYLSAPAVGAGWKAWANDPTVVVDLESGSCELLDFGSDGQSCT